MKCEKCHFHPTADAVSKCHKCGKDLCKECSIDYYGKPICAECGMPLLGMLGDMHGAPKTSVEKRK